jgi:NAD(P)-dependent dehydrogenase (short-subunit alcohol dehydrogenase family)
MELNIQDKVSIVTGGSSGIGKTTSLALAKEGSKIVVVDINFEQADKVAEEIRTLGQEAVAMKVDITNKAEVQDMLKKVLDKYQRIDILVNCAGILRFSPIEDLSEKDWNDILDVNLTGTFFCSQAVIKTMKKQKSGKIVNISSCAAKVGGVRAAASYSVSKAGVSNLTICLAKELAPYKVNVNAIAPSMIDTPMTNQPGYGKEAKVNFVKTIPLGLGKPEDIANAILFLVSDKSCYITGEILDVNGGFIMD